VPPSRDVRRKERLPQLLLVSGAILPERLSDLPLVGKTLQVRDGILDDESLDAFRLREGDPEADGPAVIVEVQAVTVEAHLVEEPGHPVGEPIESVGKLVGRGRVAATEAEVVRSDDVISPRESANQTAVLAR
jgi:hypothetical protein